MHEILDRYRRRADAFDRLIIATRADQWSNPSPCQKWTALDVVDHMVGMHLSMAKTAGRATDAFLPVASGALAAFRAARQEVEALLLDPALASTECATPTGPMTLEQQIDEVVSDDLPQHGWDLAKATGQDDTMDPADVERLWASTTAIPADVMARYRTPGAFGPGIEVYGPEVPVADDASLQHRLLGFLGRDPAWRSSTT